MGYFGIYFGGGGGDVGPLTAPVISNLSPTRATAGTAGAFSADYSTARATPIEFDLTSIVPNANITISFKRADRDETYVALGHDGEWRWPFDTESTIGDLSSEPVHVSMLPRGGWPPVAIDFQVAAVKRAVESVS